MSTMTRDLGEVAASLTHIAYLLTTAGIRELPADVDVTVSIIGPATEDAPAIALVEQLATITGAPPAWHQRSGAYGWYRTELCDAEQFWTLRCSVFAKHPDGDSDLVAENERLRARLAELEQDAKVRT